MTRFAQELSGALGEYWKRNAEQEIRKMEERQINGEIFFGADGVVRWNSNGRVMPRDCREILSYTAYRDLYDEHASAEAQEKEDAESIRKYIESRKNRGYSAEERAEMRAAFGAGTKVVDIFTGKVVSL